MPEEIEVPTEQLHETMNEEAHKAHGRGGEGHEAGISWVARVALSSAMIAVMAAVGALLAGHHANEAMLDQMKATDDWTYFQAKGIKSSLTQSKLELLEAMGKHHDPADDEKVKEYAKEQKEIEEKGKELEHDSEEHMLRHGMLARSVTTCQVAIALAAISVLTKLKGLWYASLLFGAVGAFFMIRGLL